MSAVPASKFDRSVSLLSWAYNEEESIERFLMDAIELMDRSVEDYEIVIVDDGSTDNTKSIIERYQKSHPQIKLLVNNRNRNVTYSCRRAIQAASKEYLFWQMVDWCYDIKDLRNHLELLKEFTIVVGVRRAPVPQSSRFSRFVETAYRLVSTEHLTKRSDTLGKAFISIGFYSLVRLLFGMPLSDYQNVAIYPTKWIQSINFESSSAFGGPELLLKSWWKGASLVEVPISFIPRQKGEAKGTRLPFLLRSSWQVFYFWLKFIVLNQRELIEKGKIVRLNEY
jgi:glycosyltransferase involved in cell wall biosynthesis